MNNANPFGWLSGDPTNVSPEEAIKRNEEQLAEAARQNLEFARLVFDVFNNGRGPELLQELRNRTVEMPLMQVTGSLVEGEVALSPAEWAYVREGQNSVVRFIERNMRLAVEPPEEANQERNDHGEAD